MDALTASLIVVGIGAAAFVAGRIADRTLADRRAAGEAVIRPLAPGPACRKRPSNVASSAGSSWCCFISPPCSVCCKA